MIEQSTFDFLKDLRENNYREWFHAQRPRYDAAKANVLATGEELLAGIARFDTTVGLPDLRKCMFRIARDTRFSHDKSPYKTNMGVLFNPDGTTRSPLSAYYIHIEPGNCFASCGAYMPEKETLRAIREAIDDQWEEFSAILGKPAFKKAFGDLAREDKILQRVPQGFDKESPAAEYLKFCSFYVYISFPDNFVCSPEYVPAVLQAFERTQPLNAFLNRAIRNR